MNRFLFSLLFLVCAGQLTAQAPEFIKFQAIARTADNVPITNPIEVRLTVQFATVGGTAVYVDEQTATPNERGLFTVNLGEGPATGIFSTINWAAGDHFLLAEIRQTIGGSYEALGPAQPIGSVPYALYGEDDDADPDNEIQRLQLSRDGELQISQGNTIDLGLPSTRVISIPAGALDYNSSSTVISNAGIGLVWRNNFASSAVIAMPRPLDYNGGDVSFKLMFRVSTNSSGRVDFFLRPRSYGAGDTFGDASSVTGGTVSVTPTTGFGRIYEEEIVIPASSLREDWWYISIQRNSTGAGLLTDDINVLGTSLTFAVR